MPRMLFLHIPKTAGTSLRRFLCNQLPAQAYLLDPLPLGPRLRGWEPTNFSEGEFDRYSLVAGHLDYDVVARYRRRPYVLIVLRHPVDRALSAYYYQRTPRLAIGIRSTAAQIGGAAGAFLLDGLERVHRHGGLGEFLRAERDLACMTMGNLQTEYLAGAEATAAYRQDPDRLLSVAREHLRACDGILLAERLPETLALIDPVWGEQARTRLRNDNSTLGRRAMPDHSSAELDAIAKLTSLDLELYRYAEQLIEERRQTVRPRKLFRDALPDAADYTFDQPIPGHGWYMRECGEDGWFCWTDWDAALNLKLNSAGGHELQCEVRYAASEQAWSDLAVSVNGHPVAWTFKPAAPPGQIAARIPGAWLGQSPGQVSIGFRVAHTVRPSDLDSNNPDTRRLGVALSRVRFVQA